MRIAALRRTATASILATAFISVAAPPAFAQATRTWVSGVGDDANPCSRTAPCKTFAGAISKTAVGGVISALDSAGFGAVTITKSITLDGTGTQASILALSTNGVVINAAGIDVVLRNIDITGTLPAAGCGGINGVNVLAASSVRLDGVAISGFQRGVNLPLTNANPDIFVDVSLNNVDVANNCVAGVSAEPLAGKQTRVVLNHGRSRELGGQLQPEPQQRRARRERRRQDPQHVRQHDGRQRHRLGLHRHRSRMRAGGHPDAGTRGHAARTCARRHHGDRHGSGRLLRRAEAQGPDDQQCHRLPDEGRLCRRQGEQEAGRKVEEGQGAHPERAGHDGRQDGHQGRHHRREVAPALLVGEYPPTPLVGPGVRAPVTPGETLTRRRVVDLLRTKSSRCRR
jgi:hypothetical protein